VAAHGAPPRRRTRIDDRRRRESELAAGRVRGEKERKRKTYTRERRVEDVGHASLYALRTRGSAYRRARFPLRRNDGHRPRFRRGRDTSSYATHYRFGGPVGSRVGIFGVDRNRQKGKRGDREEKRERSPRPADRCARLARETSRSCVKLLVLSDVSTDVSEFEFGFKLQPRGRTADVPRRIFWEFKPRFVLTIEIDRRTGPGTSYDVNVTEKLHCFFLMRKCYTRKERILQVSDYYRTSNIAFEIRATRNHLKIRRATVFSVNWLTAINWSNVISNLVGC